MKKNYIIYGCIAIVILLYLVPFFIFSQYVPLSPDENSYMYFSKILADNNSLSYPEPLNEHYNSTLVAPRNTVYSKITKVVSPVGFLGIFLLLSYVWPITGTNFLLFSVLSLLGILFFYLLIKEIFGEKIALFAAFTLALLPQYWFYSFRVMPDIPGLVFLFGGMAFNLLANKRNSKLFYLVSGLLFSISIWFRYIDVVYVGLFVLFFNLKNYKHILLIGSTVFLMILPIIFLNNTLYGSYFTTGYNLYSDNSPLVVIPAGNNIVTLIFSNIFRFFVLYNKLFTLLGILGIILILFKNNNNQIKYFTYYFILIAVVTLGYFSWGNFYGSLQEGVKLNFSSIRYYLIIYAMLLVYAYYFIFSLIKKRYLPYIISVILISSTLLTLSSSYSIADSHNEMLDNLKVHNDILSVTPKDAIIFSRFWDKSIFPERKVVNYYGNGLVEREVEMSSTVKLADQLLSDGSSLYFLKEDFDPVLMKERGYIYFNDYQTRFKENKINLIKVNDLVYKIERMDE